MSDSTGSIIADWAAAPENSARTVLVTMFGDTIFPVSRNIWLTQLFRLTEIFGFSDRLVRTSVYRLATDGWLESERVGRKSRYSLTDVACAETIDAAQRIYHDVRAEWSGPWSMAFLHAPTVSPDDRSRLDEHLRWHGFMALSDGVLATPGVSVARCQELCAMVASDSEVPTGQFTFDDLNKAVADGFFDEALALDETAEAFRQFVAFYDDLASDVGGFDGERAFGLRTMLVHDLRRVRLRSVDLPTPLLPAAWPGASANALASTLYHQLSKTAAPWLSEVLEVEYPRTFDDRLIPKKNRRP